MPLGTTRIKYYIRDTEEGKKRRTNIEKKLSSHEKKS